MFSMFKCLDLIEDTAESPKLNSGGPQGFTGEKTKLKTFRPEIFENKHITVWVSSGVLF